MTLGYYNKENFIEAVIKFLVGKGDGHLWFLPALLWCFVILWCLRRVVGKRSVYPVLIVSALIQFYYGYLSVDFFLFKRGMDYIFWFTLGYWFDGVRDRLSEFSSYQYGICKLLVLIEIIVLNIKYEFLNNFIVIIICSYSMYLFCIVLEKKNRSLCERWGFRLLLKQSMRIYLFHDPLEYVVLFIAFGYNWLNSKLGCLAYMGMRLAGVIMVSIMIGSAIDVLKRLF